MVNPMEKHDEKQGRLNFDENPYVSSIMEEWIAEFQKLDWPRNWTTDELITSCMREILWSPSKRQDELCSYNKCSEQT